MDGPGAYRDPIPAMCLWLLGRGRDEDSDSRKEHWGDQGRANPRGTPARFRAGSLRGTDRSRAPSILRRERRARRRRQAVPNRRGLEAQKRAGRAHGRRPVRRSRLRRRPCFAFRRPSARARARVRGEPALDRGLPQSHEVSGRARFDFSGVSRRNFLTDFNWWSHYFRALHWGFPRKPRRPRVFPSPGPFATRQLADVPQDGGDAPLVQRILRAAGLRRDELVAWNAALVLLGTRDGRDWLHHPARRQPRCILEEGRDQSPDGDDPGHAGRELLRLALEAQRFSSHLPEPKRRGRRHRPRTVRPPLASAAALPHPPLPAVLPLGALWASGSEVAFRRRLQERNAGPDRQESGSQTARLEAARDDRWKSALL